MAEYIYDSRPAPTISRRLAPGVSNQRAYGLAEARTRRSAPRRCLTQRAGRAGSSPSKASVPSPERTGRCAKRIADIDSSEWCDERIGEAAQAGGPSAAALSELEGRVSADCRRKIRMLTAAEQCAMASHRARANQNEDGTYSWKFDNYVRAFPARTDMSRAAISRPLWRRIDCPNAAAARQGELGRRSGGRRPGAAHFRHATVRRHRRRRPTGCTTTGPRRVSESRREFLSR
jgi:hypothetical protein